MPRQILLSFYVLPGWVRERFKVRQVSDSEAAGHIDHASRDVASIWPREETDEGRYLLERRDAPNGVHIQKGVWSHLAAHGLCHHVSWHGTRLDDVDRNVASTEIARNTLGVAD